MSQKQLACQTFIEVVGGIFKVSYVNMVYKYEQVNITAVVLITTQSYYKLCTKLNNLEEYYILVYILPKRFSFISKSVHKKKLSLR